MKTGSASYSAAVSGEGKGKAPDSNPFNPLNGENSEEERAESEEEGNEDRPSGLASDVLANMGQEGAASALVPGSALEKLVISALEKAIDNDTAPPSWILQLVMGSKGDASDVRVTKVKPRSLAMDFAPEATPAAAQVNPPGTPTQLSNRTAITSTSVPQNNSVNPVANTVHQDDSVSMRRFTLKNADLPADLKLEGLPSEDVPEKMTLYKAHIRLLSPDDVSESTINHRASTT